MDSSKITTCTASVWPHKHTDELQGPLDLKISYNNQPDVVHEWPATKSIIVSLEQPDERTNLTIIKLFFRDGSYPSPGHKIRQYLASKDGTRKCYIKSRITRQMKHPIPRGNWKGTYLHGIGWCIYTFQAMTMSVKPEEPLIVLPDKPLPMKNNKRIVLPDGTSPTEGRWLLSP